MIRGPRRAPGKPRRVFDRDSERNPSLLDRRRVLKGGAVLAAGMAAGLVAGRSETAKAAPRQVKVRVYDANGRPRSGVPVHVYASSTPHVDRCACSDEACAINAAQTTATNRGGLAQIGGLSANASYEICVDDRCETVQDPCGNPRTDCRYVPGTCASVTTNARGGSAKVVELRTPK